MIEIPNLDNAIVIAPQEYFSFLYDLKRKRPLEDFKFVTLENAIDNFAYQYDDRAIIYLLKKNYDYGFAVDILNSLRFVNGNGYKSNKLNDLVKIRDELISLNLLYKNEYPEKDYLDKQIKVLGYSNIRDLSVILKNYGITNIDFIKIPFKQGKHKFNVFDTHYEEIHYVLNLICQDIADGTSIDDIYIHGVDDDYKKLLLDLAPFYGLSINCQSDNSLLETPIARDFLKAFNTYGFDSAIEEIKTTYEGSLNLDLVVQLAYKFLIESFAKEDQINLYRDVFFSYEEVFQQTINSIHFLNSYNAPINSHIYFLNCSLGNAPQMKKDIEYLNDSEKEELGLFTTKQENDVSLKDLCFFITNVENIKFVSRCRYLSGLKFESPVVDFKLLDYDKDYPAPAPVVKKEYSKEFATYWAAHLLDMKKTLNKESDTQEQLQLSTGLIYKAFDQNNFFKPFKCIDKDTKMAYSYSSVEEFYECRYKYFCDHLLKLADFKPTFATHVGNIAHKVLESIGKSVSFDQAWDEAVSKEVEKLPFDEKFTAKEELLLQNLKSEINSTYDYICSFEDQIINKEILREQKFSFDYSDTVNFNGTSDKVILSGLNHENITIVDYKKTNRGQFNIDLNEFGLCLQLPFYIYLIQNGVDVISKRDFSDKEIISLFIQQILRKEINKTVVQECKMDGLITNDKSRRESLIQPVAEKTYMKLSKTPLENSLINSLSTLVETKVLEMDKLIRDGEFEIKPNYSKSGKIDPCKYCNYRTVCFRRNSDVNWIKIKDDKEETDA